MHSFKYIQTKYNEYKNDAVKDASLIEHHQGAVVTYE